MLREIFKEISRKENSAYYNIYYLTDTELRFSINDDRVGVVITTSIRHENDKYIAYGFETYNGIPTLGTRRQTSKEVKNEKEFWEWYNSFYHNSQ